jgi:hypothetical protein
MFTGFTTTNRLFSFSTITLDNLTAFSIDTRVFSHPAQPAIAALITPHNQSVNYHPPMRVASGFTEANQLLAGITSSGL